jgi:hypothetical protein
MKKIFLLPLLLVTHLFSAEELMEFPPFDFGTDLPLDISQEELYDILFSQESAPQKKSSKQKAKKKRTKAAIALFACKTCDKKYRGQNGLWYHLQISQTSCNINNKK